MVIPVKIPHKLASLPSYVDEDHSFLSDFKWYAKKGKTNKTFYAEAYIGKKGVLMHRLILDAKRGQFIDHMNRNGLDNRKKNLRFCTRSQNGANRGLLENNTSGFKGVVWSKKEDKWVASLWFEGRRRHLGYFSSKETAAKAYDQAARKFFGDFCLENFHV